MLQSDSFIFLLGAGASYDAKIPVSSKMIECVEELLVNNESWKQYKDLYYCIKSGIINAAGITGNFSSNVVNIETLVNTMDELLKSYEHPLYPFIGSWIPRLNEVCGNKFDIIKKFKFHILEKLCTDWTKCEHAEDYVYYKNFYRLQQEYNYPISIFSLNYDLCLENAIDKSNVQRGFGSGHLWNWENLDAEKNIEEPIRLYKLHGSIDWKKTNTGEVEESGKILPEETAIIFGTAYKLQYLDPFLFLVNVFRKKTLDNNTKTIFCIGYSFNDEHINGIIAQALKKDKNKRIISISPVKDEESEKKRIEKRNKDIAGRITFIPETAKSWLESITCQEIETHVKSDDVPF
ncbi:SIR2 family protein [Treponema sp. OMZ 788]|uniref:SIR2 family protein n=1 Tax=Treponema sp. OMZ 788 TaxID=2563664 RepID=UPI0020A3FDD4|nr:SIR2 family protein [Treponema sp. OMZ 788]UTC64964.1 SIR2 family protein [Treponema sp. OMZ 788]